jgi:CMP-N-acetylneuraminic acid synthetase
MGVIPARGGSKSIKLKNIIKFLGRPLIEHVIESAKLSKELDKIICSTDNEQIAEIAQKNGVEIMWRPQELAMDDTPILEVLKDIIKKSTNKPELLALLQPTSPFILPSHIDECIKKLKIDINADSIQTISTFPHNYHAFNQRIVKNGYVEFCFPEERKKYYNKQTKPKHYIFGNIVVTRSTTIIEKNEIFGFKSIAVEIPYPYAFDLDTIEDIELGEFYIKSGKVVLPWIKNL